MFGRLPGFSHQARVVRYLLHDFAGQLHGGALLFLKVKLGRRQI